MGLGHLDDCCRHLWNFTDAQWLNALNNSQFNFSMAA